MPFAFSLKENEILNRHIFPEAEIIILWKICLFLKITWRTNFNSSYKNVHKPFNMLITVFKIMAQFSTYHNTGFTTEQIIVSEKCINSSCTVWNRRQCHSHNWKPSNMARFPIITAELVTAVVHKHPNSLSNINNNNVTEEGSSVKQSAVFREERCP